MIQLNYNFVRINENNPQILIPITVKNEKYAWAAAAEEFAMTIVFLLNADFSSMQVQNGFAWNLQLGQLPKLFSK